MSSMSPCWVELRTLLTSGDTILPSWTSICKRSMSSLRTLLCRGGSLISSGIFLLNVLAVLMGNVTMFGMVRWPDDRWKWLQTFLTEILNLISNAAFINAWPHGSDQRTPLHFTCPGLSNGKWKPLTYPSLRLLVICWPGYEPQAGVIQFMLSDWLALKHSCGRGEKTPLYTSLLYRRWLRALVTWVAPQVAV